MFEETRGEGVNLLFLTPARVRRKPAQVPAGPVHVSQKVKRGREDAPGDPREIMSMEQLVFEKTQMEGVQLTFFSPTRAGSEA